MRARMTRGFSQFPGMSIGFGTSPVQDVDIAGEKRRTGLVHIVGAIFVAFRPQLSSNQTPNRVNDPPAPRWGLQGVTRIGGGNQFLQEAAQTGTVGELSAHLEKTLALRGLAAVAVVAAALHDGL